MPPPTCEFDPCERPAVKKGLCDPHYNQQWRGNTLQPINSDWVSLKDKIEYHLQPSPNGCLLWPRCTNKKGYGQVAWQGKTHIVHRAYVKALGWDVPDDMQIDHLCRVRNCANPDHLEVVTLQENVRRGNTGKVVQDAYARHCAVVHPEEQDIER